MSTQHTVAERQILRNELPIEILRLEDVNNDDGEVLRLHRAKHFEFVWVKEGAAGYCSRDGPRYSTNAVGVSYCASLAGINSFQVR